MSEAEVIKELRAQVQGLKETNKAHAGRIAELENVLLGYTKLQSEKIGGSQ